ncbi:mRNA cap guanine-N7 methyltransferase 2 [Apostasia shenzhenica]|uniref:mRNA cap guanine-N(7) methyltransferase 2 n=1 Tax=Apostasia shenzhenica TaxID=1088818 RepID=A0A2I0BGD5_9ASPA|nr:mRNA cap guanine-N7 methyltransferase 2 [Apostasia shenzhenica]
MASFPAGSRMELAHYRLFEFAKTALIKIFVSPYASVCDLYCGSGADADKWDEAQIGYYIGVDTSSSGICDARETWESQRKPYAAVFCELDPSVESLESYLQDKGIPVDIVCCLQHLQVCFESEERVRTLLQNVSFLLKPGGYFLGITPDSSTIWTKYQKIVEASHNKGTGLKAVPNCIRTDNYVITFEVEEEKFPFFGKKYMLKFANDVATETNCLVHFPSLIRLAREAGLEYVEIQNLAEFYDDNRIQFATLLCNYGANFIDPRGKLLARSFDILGLYSIFVFQKPDPDAAPPILTPLIPVEDHNDWHGIGWRQQESLEDEKNGHLEPNISHGNASVQQEKGILGPGPADLRFSEPL